MFGYLTAQTELLTPEQLARYRACYCGLCRSLKDRHGQLGRLTLNYDMCFLVLLLDSLDEPELRQGEEPCIAHPRTARAWQRTENSDYAADLTVALAYNKCLDDWHDDASPLALAETAALRRSYRKVQALWPRQCEAIEQGLRALSELEKNGEADPDAAAACFGALMAELFVRREDRWAPQLRSLGGALGRFIYILDACMDLDKDALLGRYNPLRRRYGMNNAAAFRDILKMLLGDAVRAFDALPLVQDAGLMQNILCAGLWAAFDKKFGSEEGTAHGSGSL
ncbi:MAG: hypothetical protein IJL51_04545 [Oscillospiraceae bacterium]|nr:hypothetical protein [Oscillospiraceae bacterium]